MARNVTINEYWQRVRAIQANLPAVVMLATEADDFSGDPGGSVCEAYAEVAAKAIYEKTHRVATEAEVEAWKANGVTVAKAIAQAEYERKNTMAVRLEVSPEMLAAATRQKPREKNEGDK